MQAKRVLCLFASSHAGVYVPPAMLPWSSARWLVLQAAAQRAPLRIWAARIGGVEIPNKKMIEFSLQYVYGIGHTTAKAILSETVRAMRVVAKSLGVVGRQLGLT